MLLSYLSNLANISMNEKRGYLHIIITKRFRSGGRAEIYYNFVNYNAHLVKIVELNEFGKRITFN